MHITSHHDFMLLALQLAERGRLTVSPNPMVGCVIVKNNDIVGQGFHERAGFAHAEIHALSEAKEAAKGATAYITLEPCCHYGKTPPCVDALIQAGIKKIYVACFDPNPLVAGKGIDSLRAAGIEVEVGLCEQEAKKINESFFHFIIHKRPFVIAKWAMSLDGKMYVHEGDSRQISGMESHTHTHSLRQMVDTILVGSKTAQLDNPQLTARLSSSCEAQSKNPVRIILSSRVFLPMDLKMFDKNFPGKTIVATTDAVDKDWCKKIASDNIEILILPKNKNNQVCLVSLLKILGENNITSLLVEGGRIVHESFFKENLVNKIHVYMAPVIIGSLEKKQKITDLNVSQLGHDFYFTSNYQIE